MQNEIATIVEDAVRRVFASSERSPWRDTPQASIYLACSPGTLKTWRARGEGPTYHVIQDKLIRYHVADLDAFVRGESAR